MSSENNTKETTELVAKQIQSNSKRELQPMCQQVGDKIKATMASTHWKQ